MTDDYSRQLMELAIEFRDRLRSKLCAVCKDPRMAINKDDKWYCSWECFEEGEK